MKARANALVPAVPFAVLAIALLADVLLYSQGLYSGAYTGVLPVLVAGLLLSLLPLLSELAAGRRAFVLHPAGLLVFGALAVLWLASGNARELFVRMPDKDNLRSLMVDVQLPLALLAALALGLSFSLAYEHRPFSWRREALWLLAFAAAGAVAWALGALLGSIAPAYIQLTSFLTRLSLLALSGALVALLLPALVLHRPAAAALMVAGGILTALLLFCGIHFGVNAMRILQTHAGGDSAGGPWSTLYRWCYLLFVGDTIPIRSIHWFASASLLSALSPLLLVWSLRSLLRRGPAVSVAKPI